jgi:hypothetical protein
MKTLVSVLCILALATVALATPVGPTVTFTTQVLNAAGDPATQFNVGDTITYNVYAVVSNNTLPVVSGKPGISAPHQGGIEDVAFDLTSSGNGVLNFNDGTGNPSVLSALAGPADATLPANNTAGVNGIFASTGVLPGTLTAFNTAASTTARGENSLLVATGTITAAALGTTTLSIVDSATYPISAQVYTLAASGTTFVPGGAFNATAVFPTGTSITVVPEPITLSLLALGAIGLIRRKRA